MNIINIYILHKINMNDILEHFKYNLGQFILNYL